MRTLPEYLLFSDAGGQRDEGRWRFVLQTTAGLTVLEAADNEPDVRGERLELLTLVRGLEALHQPARLRIITPSRYVRHGIAFGLDLWRRTGWTWECFGEMAPIKNEDLWRRVDRAFSIHEQVRQADARFEPRPRRRLVLSQAGGPAGTPPRREERIVRVDAAHAGPAPPRLRAGSQKRAAAS